LDSQVILPDYPPSCGEAGGLARQDAGTVLVEAASVGGDIRLLESPDAEK